MITEIITLITISYFATGCKEKEEAVVIYPYYWLNETTGEHWKINRNSWLNEVTMEEWRYNSEGSWINLKTGKKWINKNGDGTLWLNETTGEEWRDVDGDGNIWISNNGDEWENEFADVHYSEIIKSKKENNFLPWIFYNLLQVPYP